MYLQNDTDPDLGYDGSGALDVGGYFYNTKSRHNFIFKVSIYSCLIFFFILKKISAPKKHKFMVTFPEFENNPHPGKN